MLISEIKRKICSDIFPLVSYSFSIKCMSFISPEVLFSYTFVSQNNPLLLL